MHFVYFAATMVALASDKLSPGSNAAKTSFVVICAKRLRNEINKREGSNNEKNERVRGWSGELNNKKKYRRFLGIYQVVDWNCTRLRVLWGTGVESIPSIALRVAC